MTVIHSLPLLFGKKATTPIAFIQAMVLAYQKYGMDPASALRKTQIPPKLLLDATARVTATQMEQMSALAMQELDDEALGWFSRKLPWGSYGMLCRASLSSPDLGIALKRWCRHHRLLTDDVILSLDVSSNVATISLQENRDLGEMREFCHVTLFRYMLGYACWLIDSRIQLQDVMFAFDKPDHAEIYPRLFSGQTSFNAGQSAMHFDARYLQLPLLRDEAMLQSMLRQAILLTVLPYRRDKLLVQGIRKQLHNDLGLTAEELAEKLHMSVRTLYRHLQEEGFSIQQLKNDVRQKKAMECLARTSKPIKQIAFETGFKNEKSFSRAFKNWVGTTPQNYRAQAREDAGLKD